MDIQRIPSQKTTTARAGWTSLEILVSSLNMRPMTVEITWHENTEGKIRLKWCRRVEAGALLVADLVEDLVDLVGVTDLDLQYISL